ncbi:helix-turn-helix transcriptional regulator [Leptolyngbya sp. FACHB-671]|uniref:helix-turn-helix domain-containing protein n=1 Tax=Leptolyngbya sp. FACHB-671 TaxID=2692812 RepID=UPI001682B425|nr:helix-turn-helix transcriptional regulator [Leptolyngbya sp. FACHB-671]MBD2069537.1 helix-turn-helix transcriptional regulator [Leptolyngbya sp. FACHB-671]
MLVTTLIADPMGESPLKKLREELGMSQEEFARQIGTSARTISRWETGDSVPSFTIAQMKALDELLKANGKSLQDLPDTFAAD